MQKFCLVDHNLLIKYMANQTKQSVKESRRRSPMLSLFCWETQWASWMQVSTAKSHKFEILTLKTHKGKTKQ